MRYKLRLYVRYKQLVSNIVSCLYVRYKQLEPILPPAAVARGRQQGHRTGPAQRSQDPRDDLLIGLREVPVMRHRATDRTRQRTRARVVRPGGPPLTGLVERDERHERQHPELPVRQVSPEQEHQIHVSGAHVSAPGHPVRTGR